MKKLFIIAITSILSLSCFAQKSERLPIDSMVRYGRLSNGLTYYIRHNPYPEKRADFYIAQKVGSMQENDNQSGLAHFLEHMAFNGSKNFPGRKTMIDYLEKQGARFGEDLNAFTSFDETVYNLSRIPVKRTNVIDSCLLILHDWSNCLSLDNHEIDKERAIIKEEWRTRNNAQMRIWEKLFPIIYKGSKYAKRMPIGDMNIVENFKYQTLKDYYHKWYRPDLQGIIIVGDVNVDSVEAKIKQIFADIPKPVHPAKRVYYAVPNNKKPIIAITTDPEATSTNVMIFIKHNIQPTIVKNTTLGYKQDLITRLISDMFNARFLELSVKPDVPFMSVDCGDGNYFVSKTKDAWAIYASSKDGKVKETLAAILRENERVKRFGFTQTELDRVKKDVLQLYQDSYDNRDKIQTGTFTSQYVHSFTDDEPMPSITYEYKLTNEIIPKITLSEVNQAIRKLLTDKNNVVAIVGQENTKELYPTKEEVTNLFKQVKTEKIKPYIDKFAGDNKLMTVLPEKGCIVDSTVDTLFHTTLWKLSNGMKVVVKKTQFKDDEILVYGLSYGGQSLVNNANIYNAQFAASITAMGGLSHFSATDLNKVLAGNSASVNVDISNYTQSIEGGSTQKDLETLLQLIYLRFTSPRKDLDAYSAFYQGLKNRLRSSNNNPSQALSDSIILKMYPNNNRMLRMKLADTIKLNYDSILNIYKLAYANPGSFTFTFIGNINKSKLKSFVETYMASLPSGNHNASYVMRDSKIQQGLIDCQFTEQMQNAKTTYFSLYSGTMQKSLKNELSLEIFSRLLEIMYTDDVREKAGGTYGVGVAGTFSRIPKNRALLQMSFETDPQKIKQLAPMIGEDVNKIAKGSINMVNFEKVRRNLHESFVAGLKINKFWLSVLTDNYFYHENNYSDYLTVLDSIKKEDIQKFAADFVAQNNRIQVIMNPKK